MPKEIIELFSKTCPTCSIFYNPNGVYEQTKKSCCATVKIKRIDVDSPEGKKYAKIEFVPTIIIDKTQEIDPTKLSKEQMKDLLCADRCKITK